MKPYYQDATVTVYAGACRDVLRGLPDCSVDAVVTDPPYGLEFMGKGWDAPWSEKGINADAGFSSVGMSDGSTRLPRPTFTGSTNPICQNCGGRQRGRKDESAIVRACPPCDAPRFPNVRAIEMRAFQAWCQEWAVECLRVLKPGGHLLAFGGTRTSHRLACAIEDAGFEIRDSIAWLHAEGFPKNLDVSKAIDKATGAERLPIFASEYDITTPATPEARTWQGWGTALKPAHEPIVVARKPLAGTVAANVLTWGPGALNVDGCRIETTEGNPAGRWPANVVLDEHAAAELDAQSGNRKAGGNLTGNEPSRPAKDTYGDYDARREWQSYGDQGGASRFFYTAKAGGSERVRINGTAHATVKPLSLMRWLARLVTPPGGTVLEPFAGSGTTVEAAIIEGFRCVAIEREPDYLPLIVQRINRRRDPVAAVRAAEDDRGLFDLLDGAS